MTAPFPLKSKRLTGKGIVLKAAKHNLRELAAEIGDAGHIDPHRIMDNIILRGQATAREVANEAQLVMNAAGVETKRKLRRDAVLALELLFTLPEDSTINPRQYFDDATTWAENYFKVPILSSVVHLDESAPHCHVLLLPLVDGRMVGSDLHGHGTKLQAMQMAFNEQVSRKYGVPPLEPKQRISTSQRKQAISMMRTCLQANSALTDTVIDALLTHVKDPTSLMETLGLTMPPVSSKVAKAKSFVDIMTSKCKPEPHNPIGLAVSAMGEKCYPYPCVGLAESAPPSMHQASAIPDISTRAQVTDSVKVEQLEEPHRTASNVSLPTTTNLPDPQIAEVHDHAGIAHQSSPYVAIKGHRELGQEFAGEHQASEIRVAMGWIRQGLASLCKRAAVIGHAWMKTSERVVVSTLVSS